jgi:hypothetical protein
MCGDRRLEELCERRPLANIGFDEERWTGFGRGVDVCVDYCSTKRSEKFDCCETNA